MQLSFGPFKRDFKLMGFITLVLNPKYRVTYADKIPRYWIVSKWDTDIVNLFPLVSHAGIGQE